MTALTELISAGGGGGANTYTPSTATAAISVTAGSSYALTNQGKLVPGSSALAEETNADRPDFLASGESSFDRQPQPLTGDRYLPDGSIIIWYGSGSSGQIRVTLSKDGVSRFSTSNALVHQSGFTSSLSVVQSYIGETSNHYLVAYRMQFYYSSLGPWNTRAGILKVHKTTGVITHAALSSNFYVATANAGYQYIFTAAAERFGNQNTCRGGTVYVDTYFASNYGLRVAAQPLDSTGSPTGSAYFSQHSNITDSSARVGYLIKIDDTNGIFLHFYPLNDDNLRVSKITIAATGAVTTSTLATYSQYAGINSGFSRGYSTVYGGGTGSNNLYMISGTWTSAFTEMMGTYDLSDDSITWHTVRYPTYPGATYSHTAQNFYLYKNQRTYDSDSKLLYLGGQFNTGNGFIRNPVSDTTTAADINSKLIGHSSNLERFQMHYKGGIISFGNRDNPYNNSAHYAYSFDSSLALTQDAVAVALASGSAGSTVNITLKDGITSSSTLPSTHFLSKNDLYFPYAVEGAAATSVIKSIQRGEFSVSGSANITISSVDIYKSTLEVRSFQPSSSYSYSPMGKYAISSSTNIAFTSYSGLGQQGTWEVIEYV